MNFTEIPIQEIRFWPLLGIIQIAQKLHEKLGGCGIFTGQQLSPEIAMQAKTRWGLKAYTFSIHSTLSKSTGSDKFFWDLLGTIQIAQK